MKKIRLLIVGAGKAGQMVSEDIIKNKLSYEIVGFVDDDPKKHGKVINNIKVLGATSKIPEIVKRKKVEKILIAIPSIDRQSIRRIVEICKITGIDTKIMPTTYEVLEAMKFGGAKYLPPRDVEIEDLIRRKPVIINIDEISKVITGKKILITGAGGTIGSELCRQMTELKPERIVIVDYSENNLFLLNEEMRNSTVEVVPYMFDIRDKQKVDKVISKEKPDIIFHAAAKKHVSFSELFPDETVLTNVLGTKNLVRASIKNNVDKFVFISTDKAVNPHNVMGATKRVGEIMVLSQKSNTDFIVVRFGNVIGSSGSVVELFKKQISNGGPITITHPDMKRYFMTVQEAVQLIIQATSIGKHGDLFVLDMGDQIRIVDLAKDMIKLYGLVPYEDIDIVYIGARPGEKLEEKLIYEKEKLEKTKNERIFIVKNGKPEIQLEIFEKEVDKLIEAARRSDRESIIKHLKAIVPSFKND